MPGNSKRQGAIRKRQGGNPTAGSGGRRRKGLEGKGPTPKANERPAHKAHKRAATPSKSKSGAGGSSSSRGRRGTATSEWVAGRNSVLEALQANIPVTTLYVAEQTERDDRLREVFRIAADRGVSMLEVSRNELDRMTDRAVHQGLALKVPPYEYADPADLVDHARDAAEAPLIVALDSITDPRNLGAVVRSAGAFGVHGVVVPERRAAGMTASAWKTSAGAAARVPGRTRDQPDPPAQGVPRGRSDGGRSRCRGRRRAIRPGPGHRPAGAWSSGSEGKGLSRLVKETCDVLVRIPMAAATESLNAGVAAGIALYEIDRRRRA